MPERDRVLSFAALSVALLVASAAIADAATAAGGRVRRQLPPIEQGNQVVDDIFQIPISTLNAVGSLIKSTRPLVRRTRERIQQYYTGQYLQQRPSPVSQQQQQQYSSYGIRPYPSAAQQYGSTASASTQQQYGIRPYFSNYFFGGGSGGNRNRQQPRDDPLPEGRKQVRHRDTDDY